MYRNLFKCKLFLKLMYAGHLYIFLCRFEDNWIEDVAAIRNLQDDQWKELGFPMGLVNVIKKTLNDSGSQAATTSNQIDSSSNPKPVAQ